jgi:hypothetical protein
MYNYTVYIYIYLFIYLFIYLRRLLALFATVTVMQKGERTNVIPDDGLKELKNVTYMDYSSTQDCGD